VEFVFQYKKIEEIHIFDDGRYCYPSRCSRLGMQRRSTWVIEPQSALEMNISQGKPIP
jgi:hypothetical protein